MSALDIAMSFVDDMMSFVAADMKSFITQEPDPAHGGLGPVVVELDVDTASLLTRSISLSHASWAQTFCDSVFAMIDAGRSNPDARIVLHVPMELCIEFCWSLLSGAKAFDVRFGGVCAEGAEHSIH